MRDLSVLRSSILAALGVASIAACGGSTTVDRPASQGAGGGATGSTSTTTTGGGGAGGGAGGAAPSACKDPLPLLQPSGSPTGFVRCADGAIDRVAAVACDAPAPPGEACVGDEVNLSCTTDADCVDRSYGRCLHGDSPDLGSTSCGCSYGCKVDADCDAIGPGTACACAGVGERVTQAQCVRAACATNAACPGGECGFGVWDTGCGVDLVLSCRAAADACRGDAQCAGQQCSVDGAGTPFTCLGPSCAIGRPMTIEGVARSAKPAARGDWRADRAVDFAGLAPRLREALAQRLADVAAVEHASIGSFARFSIQLLALGAPPGLLAETQLATIDEIEHAKVAYAIASALAGEGVGPGPLEGVGAAVATDKAEVVRALVAEACVGETFGVAEALALADAITHEGLAAVHRRIAEDEQRHAELAWRTLAWIVRGDRAMGAVAVAAMEAAIADLGAVRGDGGLVAPEVGLASGRTIAAIRRIAAEDVVRPCMAALVAA